MSEPTTRAGRHAVRKYGLVDNEGTVLADPINDELVADVRAIEDEAREPYQQALAAVPTRDSIAADLAKGIVERVLAMDAADVLDELTEVPGSELGEWTFVPDEDWMVNRAAVLAIVRQCVAEAER